MRRALIFLFFSPDGDVDDATLHTLNGFRPLMDRIFIVSNGAITERTRERFCEIADDLLVRDNKGFDVGAYREALASFGWDELAQYDEVTLANYTFFGPIASFAPLFDKMTEHDIDFWGITSHPETKGDERTPMSAMPEHLQSFWLTLRTPLLSSPLFREYWETIDDPVSYRDVIEKFEARFTEYFSVRGFSWHAAFPHTDYNCINPAMEAPLRLIADGCPLFKKRLFFHDGPTLTKMGVSPGKVTKTVVELGYPEDLIVDGVAKRASTRELSTAMAASYVLPSDSSAHTTQDIKVATFTGTPWTALALQEINDLLDDAEFLLCLSPSLPKITNDGEYLRFCSAQAVVDNVSYLIQAFDDHDRLGIVVPFVQFYGAFVPATSNTWFKGMESAQQIAEKLGLPDSFCRTFPIAPYRGCAMYRREIVELMLDRISTAGGWNALRAVVDNELLLNRILDMLVADVAKAAGFYTAEAGSESDVPRDLIAVEEILAIGPQVFTGYTAYPFSGNVLLPTFRNRIGATVKAISPSAFEKLHRAEIKLRTKLPFKRK